MRVETEIINFLHSDLTFTIRYFQKTELGLNVEISHCLED